MQITALEGHFKKADLLIDQIKSFMKRLGMLLVCFCVSAEFLHKNSCHTLRPTGNWGVVALSRRSQGFLGPELFMDELDNLTKALGIHEDFDLLGHSWGGRDGI